ncbi:hypothetical protein C7C56_008270 [Massilia glaciei]|uniref:Uncharacterized protein n=1 Tax=Massilia glaciei TaxID=1524097 RepID=A0A2U2HNN4_9BURK|nr:hypothetical protein C7C56_008270 [Massilia glaciei]
MACIVQPGNLGAASIAGLAGAVNDEKCGGIDIRPAAAGWGGRGTLRRWEWLEPELNWIMADISNFRSHPAI